MRKKGVVCLVLKARIGSSWDVAGTRSTDIKKDLTSARQLANVTRKETLGYDSASTPNGFHLEQVEEIGDVRI